MEEQQVVKEVVKIPYIGEVQISNLVTIGVISALTVATFIYAVVFTSNQTSDIPTTYGTLNRNKDINDTMTELLGNNWIAVVLVFYIMSLLIIACLYSLNKCSQINIELSDPQISTYLLWGLYGLLFIIIVGQLVTAGWYYVNDYNNDPRTLISNRDYEREKREEDVATVGIFLLGLVLLIASVSVVYYFIKK
jgi:heme/copper-type cytochrome/quinol oxidase subunit 2